MVLFGPVSATQNFLLALREEKWDIEKEERKSSVYVF